MLLAGANFFIVITCLEKLKIYSYLIELDKCLGIYQKQESTGE